MWFLGKNKPIPTASQNNNICAGPVINAGTRCPPIWLAGSALPSAHSHLQGPCSLLSLKFRFLGSQQFLAGSGLAFLNGSHFCSRQHSALENLMLPHFLSLPLTSVMQESMVSPSPPATELPVSFPPLLSSMLLFSSSFLFIFFPFPFPFFPFPFRSSFPFFGAPFYPHPFLPLCLSSRSSSTWSTLPPPHLSTGDQLDSLGLDPAFPDTHRSDCITSSSDCPWPSTIYTAPLAQAFDSLSTYLEFL